ncbi:hypothetical protein GCM10023226_00570 [Nocardioides nanhaiensis]|uniref:SGNH/GDSL hydrolase family protein n=1 Tax=Nocardioides nanhaiensis TaxID=1476871 RepID=A0ABP8VNE1_9ACTN
MPEVADLPDHAPVTITGNSHVIALARAERPAALTQALGEVLVYPWGNGRHESEVFTRREGDGVALTVPQYATATERHTGHPHLRPDRHWVVLGPGHAARTFRDPTWRTHAPAALRLPGVEPVSDGLLTALLERDQRGLRALYRDALAAGLQVVALSAPPPRRDHRAITDGTPAAVVAHLDTTAYRLWERWLAAEGVPLVPRPAGTADDEGFLLPELAARTTPRGTPDHHHANEAYGALALAELARTIGGAAPLG